MRRLSAVIAAVIMCLSMCIFMASCGGGDATSGSMSGSADMDFFLGGWGYIEDEYSCNTVYITDEDGYLAVEICGHPGGGYDLVFDLDNVTIDGDVLKCTDGEAITDFGPEEGCTLVARPSSTSGEYEFTVSDGNGEQMGPVYSYSKVANSRNALDKWVKNIVDM